MIAAIINGADKICVHRNFLEATISIIQRKVKRSQAHIQHCNYLLIMPGISGEK